MKIQFYRLFVEKTKQLSLLEDKKITKKDLLYEAFNIRQPLHFKNATQELAFITQKEAGSQYIYGTLAKASHVSVSMPPEENFQLQQIETWPHVSVLINIDSDPETGQTLAIEYKPSIFDNPIVQLRALLIEITKKKLREKGYEIAVNPITDKHEFWSVVKDNAGHISSLSFDFAAPNLFKTKDELNKELKEATEEFGITSTEINLKNSEGELKIPENNPFVKQGLEYVSRGGGEYRLKLKNKKIITSEESVKSKVIDETEFEVSTQKASELKEFCDKLFLWLKR
jgi:hypothetical protein